MLQISAQQLAELLNGIARAQAAVVQGLEVGNPGTRSNYVVPAIQNAAHLRDHPDPTLTDLPVRMLLASMGRVGPDIAQITRELERLLPSEGAPAASAGAGAEAAGENLDFSASR
jgi:hypothetical protein